MILKVDLSIIKGRLLLQSHMLAKPKILGRNYNYTVTTQSIVER
jgi:hypothetical protein